MTLTKFEAGDTVYDNRNIGGIVTQIADEKDGVQILLVKVGIAPNHPHLIGSTVRLTSMTVRRAYIVHQPPAKDTESMQRVVDWLFPEKATTVEYAVEERTFLNGPWDTIRHTDPRGPAWTLERATEFVNGPSLAKVPTTAWRRVVERHVTEWKARA